MPNQFFHQADRQYACCSPPRKKKLHRGGDGHDTSPESAEKPHFSDGAGSKTGSAERESAPSDPDLTVVMERWARLPQAVKAAIVALVRVQEGNA